MNTGSPQFGRPSMGAWVTYGIGSESTRPAGLRRAAIRPARPARRRGALGQRLSADDLSGRAVPLRRRADPQPVAARRASRAERQRDALEAIRDLNADRLDATGDPEIATRIAAYEMAYRMQTQRPGADRSVEENDTKTLELYGAEPGKPSFANNCLLARRLVERGVRFVQLYHTDWDHHGDAATTLEQGLDDVCSEIDQPTRRAGQRPEAARPAGRHAGHLGRRVRPHADGRGPRRAVGRNHHIDAYTMWLAGGGVKPGLTVGETDEIGYDADRGPRPRPRPAGDDPAPAGPGPHAS